MENTKVFQILRIFAVWVSQISASAMKFIGITLENNNRSQKCQICCIET